MAVTGKGRAPFRSTWLAATARRGSLLPLIKGVTGSDEDVAETLVWNDWFFPSSSNTFSASITLGALTLSGVGDVDIAGSAGITLGSIALSTTGGPVVVGAADVALGALTLSGAFTTSTSANYSGSITLGALALAGVGDVDVAGAASIPLGALALSAVGDVDVAAAAGINLGALTLAAVGDVDVAGSASVALGALIAEGAAGVLVRGSAGIQLDALTLAGEYTTPPPAVDYSANITLGELLLSATGTTTNTAPSVGGGAGGIWRVDKRTQGRFERYLDSLETREARASIKLGALRASGTIAVSESQATLMKPPPPIRVRAAITLGSLTVRASARLSWDDVVRQDDEDLLLWL